MSKIDELVKLSALLHSKVIDADEFERLKAELMGRPDSSPTHGQPVMDVTGGAANNLVNLEWTKFIVGLTLTAIIGLVVLSQVFRFGNPFSSRPTFTFPPGYEVQE